METFARLLGSLLVLVYHCFDGLRSASSSLAI